MAYIKLLLRLDIYCIPLYSFLYHRKALASNIFRHEFLYFINIKVAY